MDLASLHKIRHGGTVHKGCRGDDAFAVGKKDGSKLFAEGEGGIINAAHRGGKGQLSQRNASREGRGVNRAEHFGQDDQGERTATLKHSLGNFGHTHREDNCAQTRAMGKGLLAADQVAVDMTHRKSGQMLAADKGAVADERETAVLAYADVKERGAEGEGFFADALHRVGKHYAENMGVTSEGVIANGYYQSTLAVGLGDHKAATRNLDLGGIAGNGAGVEREGRETEILKIANIVQMCHNQNLPFLKLSPFWRIALRAPSCIGE